MATFLRSAKVSVLLALLVPLSSLGADSEELSPAASAEELPSCTQVTVGIDYPNEVRPADVAGVLLRFSYPPDRVRIPGTANDATVRARVRGSTAIAGGVFGVADNDHADPPHVSASLITLAPEGIARGAFVTIDFDCVSRRAPLSAADLDDHCVAEASSRAGTPIAASCDVLSIEARS